MFFLKLCICVVYCCLTSPSAVALLIYIFFFLTCVQVCRFSSVFTNKLLLKAGMTERVQAGGKSTVCKQLWMFSTNSGCRFQCKRAAQYLRGWCAHFAAWTPGSDGLFVLSSLHLQKCGPCTGPSCPSPTCPKTHWFVEVETLNCPTTQAFIELSQCCSVGLPLQETRWVPHCDASCVATKLRHKNSGVLSLNQTPVVVQPNFADLWPVTCSPIFCPCSLKRPVTACCT